MPLAGARVLPRRELASCARKPFFRRLMPLHTWALGCRRWGRCSRGSSDCCVLLLRLRHQRLLHPPPTSLSLRTPRRIRRHRQPRWAQRLAVGHGAAHRGRQPLLWIPHCQRALRPHVQFVGVLDRALTRLGLAIGAPPSGPPAPTPASVAPPLLPGVTVTTSPTPDGGLQVSLVTSFPSAWMGHVVKVHVLACSRGSA